MTKVAVISGASVKEFLEDAFRPHGESRPDLATRDAEQEELRSLIRQRQRQQDKKLLKYCLAAALLVSPIIGLSIWSNLEAKQCEHNPIACMQ